MTASADHVVPELRVAVMRLARRLRNERGEDDLTPSQMAVLGTLFRDGPQTPSRLAEVEHVQPPSMTRIIAALERGGWVTKEPHPQDGRQLLISATGQARTWVTAERQRRDQWLSARLALLSDRERQMLVDVVPILNRLAQAE